MVEKKEKKEKKAAGAAGRPKPEKAPKKPAESAKAEPREKKTKHPEPSAPARRETKPRAPSQFETRYKQGCVPALMKQFGYKNVMQVPRLKKIVVNTSIKEALQDIKILQNACDEIAAITGQRPVITKAKKSIANFKLRKGQSIGARVTLRKRMMHEFMNRLVNVALPRVRDFRGVSTKSFDGRGNYTLGLSEQMIFPEIVYDKVSRLTGMDITFVTTARTDEEGMALLSLMGMPFKSQ